MAGPARDYERLGEVYAIYVDPAAIGTGAGSLLFDAALDELRAAEAMLWVHPDNALGRRFYERKGWTPDDEYRYEEVLGVTAPEVRYRGILK